MSTPIDWTQPICLDTQPPRPARVARFDRDGDPWVEADWQDDGFVDDWCVRFDGTIGGTPYPCPRVRNLRPDELPAPAGGVTAELLAAAQALLADWDERCDGRQERYVAPRDDDPLSGYWSPSAAMVSSERIAGLRAAIAKATGAA